MAECGMTGAYSVERARAQQRVLMSRTGKAPAVLGHGAGPLATLLEAAGELFSEREQAVQVRYVRHGSEAAAVTAFLRSGDLLLSAVGNVQVVGDAQLAWDEAMPVRFTLAGEAAVVIVHPVNAVQVLTIEQIRELFGSGSRSWKEYNGKDMQVRLYAPMMTERASEIFHSKVLPASRSGRVNRKGTSAEVIAAVAIDPNGVGFVNYAAIHGENKQVRMVGVMSDKGIVRPDAESILNGSWPLSTQLNLYVKPNTTVTGKEFVRFLLKNSPRETFLRNGWVPAFQDKKGSGGP